jgi:hypothetical protein
MHSEQILCDKHPSLMWPEHSPFAVSPVYCCGDLGCRRHYGPNFGYFYPALNAPPYIDPADRFREPCPEKGELHFMALTLSNSGSEWYCFDCHKMFTLPNSASPDANGVVHNFQFADDHSVGSLLGADGVALMTAAAQQR